MSLVPAAAPGRPATANFPPGRGILVVGHGTADSVGAAETRRVAEQVAELLPGVPVALGFLEVIGPSISEALAVLAAAGCREVVTAPLLLFAAGHAKRDVPEALAAAAAAEGLTVCQADPFGCHPDLLSLSRQRRQEALAGAAAVPPEETVLVMVGRGSSDPTAVSQLDAFTAATLAADPPPRRVLLGFVAAARPTLAEALAAAADPGDAGLRRIMVQPHLLFRGHVEEQVAAAVADGRTRHPGLEWMQVPRLGPDRLVARAVVDRAAAAAAQFSAAAATKNASPNRLPAVTMKDH
jgi:sirohydrochlorin cobaltochelatase